MTQREFDTAGLLSRNGKLGSTVSSGKLLHLGGPIEVRNGKIVWSLDPYSAKEIEPPETLLDDFVNLWEAEDAIILKFAKKWGPMRINRRGDLLASRYRFTKTTLQGSEPLTAWRFLSHRAYSTLRIAADLHNQSRGAPADWEFLSSDHGGKIGGFLGMPNWATRGSFRGSYFTGAILGPESPGYEDIPWPISELRRQVAGELNAWLTRYEVGLRTTWEETPQIHLTYGASILSAVALQLTLAVLKEHTVYTCSGCGLPYSRGKRKRPKSGDANFCEKCGIQEAWRQAQARRREKQKKAKSE